MFVVCCAPNAPAPVISMPAISADCPHCNSKRMGFSFVAETGLAPQKPGEFMVLFKCNKCQGGLVVEYKLYVNHGQASPGKCPSDPEALGFIATNRYPGEMPSNLPSDIPTPLDRYLSQAMEGIQSGHYDASGAMCRKVIDVSTQKLLGEDSSKYGTIQKRIDALAVKNMLTPDLKDWAHQVRLGGNDAAHDEDPYTQDEAEELLSFVELYLTYVYSMPGRLAARRKKAEAAKQAESVKPA